MQGAKESRAFEDSTSKLGRMLWETKECKRLITPNRLRTNPEPTRSETPQNINCWREASVLLLWSIFDSALGNDAALCAMNQRGGMANICSQHL